MRRSSLLALLSTFALVACSSAGGSTSDGASANGAGSGQGAASAAADGGAEPTVPVPGGGKAKSDGGSDAGTDAAPQVTPDGCVITASPADDACVVRDELGVFASSSKGSDAAGDGTMAQPFATAAHAITFAKAHQKRVFLCAEAYAENVTIENGVSIFGGLDCTQPKWTVVDAKAHFAAPTSPAARADNVTTTTAIEAVEIFAPDATVPSGSSIGMIANASPALLLRNVWLQAGNAMDGVAGGEPAANDEGPIVTGTPIGGNSICDFLDCAFGQGAGSAGGISACGGGQGGGGGSRGYFAEAACVTGLCRAVHPSGYYWDVRTAPGPGVKLGGSPGARGAAGQSAQRGVIDASGYTPGNGNAGTDGLPGIGGKGGDGEAPPVDPFANGNAYSFGRYGAAGGAGGCGGHVGTAGTGGGASIALVAVKSALSIKRSKLTSQSGGNGGSGTFGSAATAGGAAGACDPQLLSTCGAHGGGGGEAGVSGAGAGGPSVALAFNDALPGVDAASTLQPGAGGSGVALQSNGGKAIQASGTGASQAFLSF